MSLSVTDCRPLNPWECPPHPCTNCGCQCMPLSTDTGGVTYHCSVCSQYHKVAWVFRDLCIGPNDEDSMSDNEHCRTLGKER